MKHSFMEFSVAQIITKGLCHDRVKLVRADIFKSKLLSAGQFELLSD